MQTSWFFVLVVGNSRAGTTLIGSIIDVHPKMLCANESRASRVHWRGYDRAKLLDEIVENARSTRCNGRRSAGYEYAIAQSEKEPAEVRVAGDKIYNPTLLMLHGALGLLPSLRDLLGLPIKLVHVMRNPLDVITTMRRLSGAPVLNRIRWYFMHLDAAMSVRDSLDEDDWLDVHLEDMILDRKVQIDRLARHLDERADDLYIARCRERMFDHPKRTRDLAQWSAEARRELKARAALYPILTPYLDEIDGAYPFRRQGLRNASSALIAGAERGSDISAEKAR